MSRFLVLNDGLFLGSSSAVNLVAAVKLAKRLPKGEMITTILCDSGSRHVRKVVLATRWLLMLCVQYSKFWYVKSEAARPVLIEGPTGMTTT